MGIKHFFYWFQKNHSDCIQVINKNQQITTNIDTLALDLNGIFHPAAQKIFKYGSFKKLKSLMRKQSQKKLKQDVFKEICKIIEQLIDKVQPKKRLLLCVDGVAGAAKMRTQRQRRYRAVLNKENEENDEQVEFDSNSITPGTEFMHDLNNYIDWYIRMNANNNKWKELEIIFSSEKVPGEGEAKCFLFMRKYCKDLNETFCIYGLDADLIMLCLSLNRTGVYVLRDEQYSDDKCFINIDKFKYKISKMLETKSAIIDFVFICFMVGNDFLPQIPGFEIFTGGIEILINIYKKICKPYGLINQYNFKIKLNILLDYFKHLSFLEVDCFKNKYKNRQKYFEDPLLEKYFSVDDCVENEIVCDFDGFKKEYYTKYFNNVDINYICNEYIKGLQWIIHYYNMEIPSWSWYYPFYHAPFLDDLSKCIGYTYNPFIKTKPLDSFQQLLYVLPPQSSALLPYPLKNIMTNDNSPLKPYYPTKINIDISGKKAEWEGIVILPLIDRILFNKIYKQYLGYIDKNALKRNVRDNAKKYVRVDTPYIYKSPFGIIKNCKVKYMHI